MAVYTTEFEEPFHENTNALTEMILTHYVNGREKAKDMYLGYCHGQEQGFKSIYPFLFIQMCLNAMSGALTVLYSNVSVQPKPDFGIGNQNQGSILILEPNLFSKPKLFFFSF